MWLIFYFSFIPTHYGSTYTCPSRVELTCIDFSFKGLAPPYPRMLNFAKFCKRKEDINNIYDLLLEVIDSAILKGKLTSDVDWL